MKYNYFIKKSLFFLFIFNAFIYLNAQKILEGNIIIDDYKDDIVNVEIRNITQNKRVISTDYHFQITINVDDTLLFESSASESRKIVITKEVYDKGKLNIHLSRGVIQLEDLVVDRKLTGYLEKDIKSVHIKNNDSLNTALSITLNAWDIINMKKENIIEPINGEMPSNIDFIKTAYLLTSIFKKNKDYKIKNNKKSLLEIREYLGDDFFKDLNIPTSEISFFIQYTFNRNYNLLENNYLDLIKVFSEEAKNYLKRN